ncbi:MAG: hypothetical protein KJ955_06615 [Nanoarchaeota archaeon]|nr:hypothetical protein [Nanoarchaeota archaeon]
MGLETILKAYLMIFWPETGPLSKTTMLDYKIVTAQFDESMPVEQIKVNTYYENIGAVPADKPADYVETHRGEMYVFGWNKLEKTTKQKRDRNISRVFFVRIKHAGLADGIAKGFPHLLFKKYMEGDKELRYIALSKGSSVLN